MRYQLERYLSQYKLGRPVIAPSGREGAFDRLAVDVPVPFRHAGKCYMMHVGFDGKGYQTALCVAQDDSLLSWKQLGVILPRGEAGAWDAVGRAGTCILCDDALFWPAGSEKNRREILAVLPRVPRRRVRSGAGANWPGLDGG